ncbi:hypothetical protein [Thermodesulfatator autotrophicus]|uniref:Uncharacterized protein n=1 Tax=Thermodesulfatator autotrophicus TaxID=1795632 RepID=A0A177E7S0_9BACT|nr:hypothetical protein [Thermodesulfatator autotrophicus]OAG27541.1 hypothetical protein TH606_06540 [Thermodesulfatator autotrophicus]
MKMKVVKVSRGEKKRLKVILVAHKKTTRKEETRRCLSCGRVFRSRGPWNRLCRSCRERVAQVAASGFAVPVNVGRA